MAYAKNRMQCFPFVEESDSIVFGDATVYYAGIGVEIIMQYSPHIQ